MDDRKVEDVRRDIPFLAKGIYVDNASVTPMTERVRRASREFDDLVCERLRESKAIAQPVFDRGRELAARLVGASPESIAYIQNTSHGLSLVALGLDWRAGDNLVVCDQEFPSNYLCWTQLESRGVEIRRIASPDGRVEPRQIRDAMDGRTRLVAVSHVQFYSGFRVDVAALGEICAPHGALLVVDGSQSIGALALDVGAAGVDVLAVSAHKWLMGPRGIGFASFSPRALAQVTPRIVGWLSVADPFAFRRTLDFLPDARRFESGTPNGAGIFGLAERLAEIDELGIDWIENRVLDLGEMLRDAALRSGIRLRYRFDRPSRSGISIVESRSAPVADVHAALTASGIFASIRNGAIRIAPHYYNTAGEMERIVAVMASVD